MIISEHGKRPTSEYPSQSRHARQARGSHASGRLADVTVGMDISGVAGRGAGLRMAGRGKPADRRLSDSPSTLINADTLVGVYWPNNGHSDREPDLGR